jgi:arginyl-tRNA synthetase
MDGALLRIFFTPNTLPRLLLPYINNRKDLYGKDPSIGLRDPFSTGPGRKKLVIEFSSPNIVNELESKHLRSTILGACIANLYENMGWDVVRINYLGDWGMQMGLLGVEWEKFGSEEEFRADPVRHMFSIYSKINKVLQSELVARRVAVKDGLDTLSIENPGALCREKRLL